MGRGLHSTGEKEKCETEPAKCSKMLVLISANKINKIKIINFKLTDLSINWKKKKLRPGYIHTCAIDVCAEYLYNAKKITETPNQRWSGIMCVGNKLITGQNILAKMNYDYTPLPFPFGINCDHSTEYV